MEKNIYIVHFRPIKISRERASLFDHLLLYMDQSEISEIKNGERYTICNIIFEVDAIGMVEKYKRYGGRILGLPKKNTFILDTFIGEIDNVKNSDIKITKNDGRYKIYSISQSVGNQIEIIGQIDTFPSIGDIYILSIEDNEYRHAKNKNNKKLNENLMFSYLFD